MIYISYYVDVNENNSSRKYYLAANTKIDYITDTINALGEQVDHISFAQSSNRKAFINYCRGSKKKIRNNISLRLFSSVGSRFFIINTIGKLLTSICFISYILTHIKKNEKIIVYHSLGYARCVYLLKKMIKFILILQVEEIYSDVISNDRKRKLESKLFKSADAYIFSTELLEKKINTKNKMHTIIYGQYNIYANNDYAKKDNRTHIVYAGTLDPRKGGAIAATAAAQFLDCTYHVHILGFGSNNDVNMIINRVKDISCLTECRVTYDGVLKGEEFNRFLQQCDIGLSTQDPIAKFNDTSFPSKILTYMSNGLKVVSIRIPVVECSAINSLVYYYEQQDPEKIADAIIRAKESPKRFENIEIIKKLDLKFKYELASIIF